MEFSSLVFLFLFFPLFLFSYFVFKSRKYRNFVLLLFSLVFYAWGEPIYILLMLFSITINYFIAKLIDNNRGSKDKMWLIIGLVINIGLLAIFKYTDFIIGSLNSIFGFSIGFTNIPLPIGISFYTFQIISYIVDVYWKQVKVQQNIFYLGCYITAFPQLIAGPIVRYETIEDELNNRKESLSDFSYGVRRFIRGLGKKVLIANHVGYVATAIFSQDASVYGFLGAWIGMIAYTLQIYFDFSGYSDMAIGMGRMLGFHFLENFNFPYIAKSVTDFWRRWHISLSSFFRDYVYIPLGGNRVSKLRFILNIMIVWGLTGLWHGASVNFLLWGLYYGILLLIEKLFLKKYLDRCPSFLQHFYLIVMVIFGWVLFRSASFKEISDIVTSMLGMNGFGSLSLYVYNGVFQIKYIFFFVCGIIFCTPVLTVFKDRFDKLKYGSYIIDACLIFIFLASILFMVVGSYNPFIYFRF